MCHWVLALVVNLWSSVVMHCQLLATTVPVVVCCSCHLPQSTSAIKPFLTQSIHTNSPAHYEQSKKKSNVCCAPQWSRNKRAAFLEEEGNPCHSIMIIGPCPKNLTFTLPIRCKCKHLDSDKPALSKAPILGSFVQKWWWRMPPSWENILEGVHAMWLVSGRMKKLSTPQIVMNTQNIKV